MTAKRGGSVRRAGGLGLAAAILLAGTAFADDAQLRQRIESRLGKAELAERGQIDVAVENGVAVLSGFTTTVDARTQAEKAARKETKKVDNRLRVVPAVVEDKVLQRDVADAVLGYAQYGVFDSVGAAVEQGTVTLRGSVQHPWRKADIERRVAQLEGVREIRNEIRVQSVSPGDERLRVQLYQQIYGNSLFQHYATFVDPPIRIIVDHGNVTLTGVVNSPLQKTVLGSIARSALAFRVDNQVQLESEIGKEPQRGAAES